MSDSAIPKDQQYQKTRAFPSPGRWGRFPLVFVWLAPLIIGLWLVNAYIDEWTGAGTDSSKHLGTDKGEVAFALPFPVGSGVPDDAPEKTPGETPAAPSDDSASLAFEPANNRDATTNTPDKTASLDATTQTEIRDLLKAVQASLAALTEKTSANRTPLLPHIERINEQIAVVVKRSETAALAIEDINKRLGVIEKRLTQKTRTAKKTRTRKPPFKVVSIDLWGNSPVAVVTMDDKSMMKSVGESLAGWSFVDIDATKRTVSVSKSGTSAILPVVQ